MIALALSLVLILCSLVSTGAQQQRRNTRSSTSTSQQQSFKRPRLVLLIVVDQFRYDYLDRFQDLYGESGLKRLQRDGASWLEANYDHMPTYTAPGHATMLTGTWPSETGIVGNDWPNRDTGTLVTSVSESDPNIKLLGGNVNERASSPRRLMASTVGDQLRMMTNDRSKVIGISIKDRSAILPAGRHASAAYWFSTASGSMVSSSYYFDQVPAWVTSFNNTRPADQYFRKTWDRLIKDESVYVKYAGQDSPPWEDILNAPGDTNAFPHVITGGATQPNSSFYNALDYSPFSNDMLLSFAQQAIINEGLGKDEDTDVLTLSFSANDYVGHRYGPYSQEMMDITLRTDQQIAALLDFVNARVGLQNTLVVFTADHGVAPIPEHAVAMGLIGERIFTDGIMKYMGGRIQSGDVLRAMREAIRERFNRRNESKDTTADYIQSFKDGEREVVGFRNGNLYFNRAALRRDGIPVEEIERVAGEAAMTVTGISRYFTRTQLERGAISPADPVARRVFHGFYPRRSGDVIVVYEPFKYLIEYPITATHGSPYSYDTHVPLIIMGGGLTPGRYAQASTPADIAPTIAHVLRVQMGTSVTGRVLTEALMTMTRVQMMNR